jgi:hypothetical protein
MLILSRFINKHGHHRQFLFLIGQSLKIYSQVSTLTFVRLSGTSENWRRTIRSCITVVRRDKWKKSDSQTCRYDGQINFHWYTILGLLYKRALFDLQFVHNLSWLKLKWNTRSKLFYFIIYCSSRHALMKFKDIDKIKVAISEML